jgi:hypothetical protein
VASPSPAPRSRRLLALAGGLLALVVVGCGQILGESPAPTPADFPGIAGALGRRGLALGEIASGDAGCADPDLARTAIRFRASGLDQAAPVTLRVYIFRDRAAFDRRRLSVDACAQAWIADAGGLISIDAAPFVLIGQGPVGPSFGAALRSGLREAAGGPGA